MTFTGSHNVDKYMLPPLLNIITIAKMMTTNKYFKNIINNTKKLNDNKIKSILHVNSLRKLCNNDNYRCFELLCKLDIDVNQYDTFSWSLLHYLCSSGYTRCATILIKLGANVNIRSGVSYPYKTPLHFASKGKYIDCMKILLDNGADATARDVEGYTPLYYIMDTEHHNNNKCVTICDYCDNNNKCVELLKKYSHPKSQ
jgi:ankyrin repeat protein